MVGMSESLRMKKDPENMVKKAISEELVEMMFKELGFYVMKLGKEYTINPITHLQHFIKKCGGNIDLEPQ